MTVCFGNTRIVVPCGSGNISVQDLQEKACVRYRRAIGKVRIFCGFGWCKSIFSMSYFTHSGNWIYDYYILIKIVQTKLYRTF